MSMPKPPMLKKLKLKYTCKKDLQDLLELTPKRDILFIIEDKCKSQKSRNTWSNRQFGLGVQNEAGQSLTEFCEVNTLVIANTLF